MAKIVSFKKMEDGNTYDLEVDHPDHQFYLSNGLLTSNSHATVYSINSYYTAYLKQHYPTEYMTAVLKSEAAKHDKKRNHQAEYIKEAERMGVKILPPDINKSDSTYKMLDKGKIIMGFDSLNGVGEKAAIEIFEKQPYKSMAHFYYKVNSMRVRKDTIQALARAGCFDAFGLTRKNAHDFYAEYRKAVKKYAEKREKEQEERGETTLLYGFTYDFEDPKSEWKLREKVENEISSLGMYISGNLFNILKRSKPGFTGQAVTAISAINSPASTDYGGVYSIEAVITNVIEMKIKKEGANQGKEFGKFMIEDENGDFIEMIAWPDLYIPFKSKLKINTGIRALCKLNVYEGQKSLVAMDFNGIYSL